MEKVITADGSHTLFVPELDETYHSVNGAIQESEHVFIEAGLKHILKDHSQQINILEIGFGTGLNAFLSLLVAERMGANISCTSVEAYPLDLKMTASLNYPEILNEKRDVFESMHEIPWGCKIRISKRFSLKKLKADISELELPSNEYDLVYYDAFAPDVQPELWTAELFVKIFAATKRGGALVTYSSKGLVKRNLRYAGYSVERLAGPPGKRHMLRALKVG